MHFIPRSLLAACALMACVAIAGTPGSQWRFTVSISAPGLNLPAQLSEMCVTGSSQDRPLPSGQNGCKYTELSHSGNTVRYAVECKAMKGTGEITYGADHYVGKFDMQGEHGAVSATYAGQKLGTCDSPRANNAAPSGAVSSNSSSVAAAAGNAVSTAGSEVKDVATDAATDTAQSAKDDATQSVKEKASSVLKGLFGR
jgi:hypothetical protein